MIPSCVLATLGGGIGSGELIIVFIVVLLLFGPRKLPGAARMLGRVLEQLRRASTDFRRELLAMEKTPPSAPPASDATKPASAEPSAEPGEGPDDLAG